MLTQVNIRKTNLINFNINLYVMFEESNAFDKINPKWQARLNRCVDITRMIANKSPDKIEILFEQLKESIYAHTQSRLEAFIFVCTNIC